MRMKVAVWLFTLALSVACLACWCVVQLLSEDWHRRFGGVPLPAFTRLVLQPHSWLLWCPLPWVVAAFWLIRRKLMTPSAVLVFSGSVCLAGVIVVSCVTLAALLPYMNLIIVL